MVIEYILFIIGIYFLMKGADWIVEGSSSMARKIGVSNLIIGLTIVAVGTSLPELTVGIISVIKGDSGVIFGNVIGASIADLLLVLGVTAIIKKINVETEMVWKQIPFALLAAFILFLFSSETIFGLERTSLTFVEGFLFVALLIYFLYSVIQMGKHEKESRKAPSNFDLVTNIRSMIGKKKVNKTGNWFHRLKWKTLIKFGMGVLLIYFGGQWVVSGAVFIAAQLGMSAFLISATIVSLGTTLPEFVVSVFAAIKGKIDIAVGNIIGSTVFNMFGVLGISAIVRPVMIPSFIYIDVAIMFFALLLLFIFMFTGKTHSLSRKDGIMFLLFYILYIAYLIIRG
jgi:cation:H+ antiporter